MEIVPKLLLPNGDQRKGFELKSDGTVHILGVDGKVHQIHPQVVHALATHKIAPGVWALAVQAMANPKLPRLWLPPNVKL